MQSLPPRVTVLIPTYNRSNVLPYSIGSVLRQTFARFELIVIGDGCTDDSEQVVAAIPDPRVRWINLPVNTRHQSGPNNEGLRQARGEFIAYLGHDDLWLPQHLALLVAALDGGADIAYTILGSVAPEATSASPLSALPRFEPGDWIPPSCLAHRRSVTEAIGGWGDYRKLGVDPEVDLLRRAAEAGYRFAAVPRFSAIKFPAGGRRNVYAERPSHEQAKWWARIETEPDFEAEQVGKWVLDAEWWQARRYQKLLRVFLAETLRRLRKRFSPRAPRRTIDQKQEFEGL